MLKIQVKKASKDLKIKTTITKKTNLNKFEKKRIKMFKKKGSTFTHTHTHLLKKFSIKKHYCQVFKKHE